MEIPLPAQEIFPGPYPLSDGFTVTIPVGLIVDPVTNTGWEKSGVTPDIAADTGNELQVALLMAKEKILK